MNPVSYKEALAQGLEYYFTGKPCCHGHISQRITKWSLCLACYMERRKPPKETIGSKEAKRRYRERNREKLKASYAEYCARNPQEVREQKRRYASKNIERERERSRKKSIRDREKHIDRNKRWRKNNRDKVNATARRFRERHPLKARIMTHNRRALTQGLKGKQTSQGIAELFRLQKNKCGYCRADLTKVAFHIDHITPVSKGGSNERKNLQILCQPCNSRKHARDPIEFAQSRGMLL